MSDDWVRRVVETGLPDRVKSFIQFILGPTCLNTWKKQISECVKLAEKLIENSERNFGRERGETCSELVYWIESSRRFSPPKTLEDVKKIEHGGLWLYETIIQVLNRKPTSVDIKVPEKPHDIAQRELVERLLKYGWRVSENIELVKHGRSFYADIIAYHDAYKDLGCFLFEVKTHAGSFNSAAVAPHKQITAKYIGSYIARGIACQGGRPQVFVYYSPITYANLLNQPTVLELLLRFYNEYGIGVLFPDIDYIIFHPEYSLHEWSVLYLDTSKSKPSNIKALKEKLSLKYGELLL